MELRNSLDRLVDQALELQETFFRTNMDPNGVDLDGIEESLARIASRCLSKIVRKNKETYCSGSVSRKDKEV